MWRLGFRATLCWDHQEKITKGYASPTCYSQFLDVRILGIATGTMWGNYYKIILEVSTFSGRHLGILLHIWQVHIYIYICIYVNMIR